VREFLPGVSIWSWFSEPHGYDFHGTLLLCAEGNLCVDPSEEVLDRLAREGVAQILITNRNHTRAANRVRERLRELLASFPTDAGSRSSSMKCSTHHPRQHESSHPPPRNPGHARERR